MGNTKETIFHNWIQGNIFGRKKLDGTLYIIFYIIIPVIITAWSLYAFPEDITAGTYCYLTILISALNCLYDAINRWKSERTIINVKLFIMILSIATVAIYCLYVIIGMLLTGNLIQRLDILLCVYFITIAIALWDFVCCIAGDLAMKKYC